MDAFLAAPNISTFIDPDNPVNGIYGCRIDMAYTGSDTIAHVEYTDDNADFEPLSCNQSSGLCSYGDWADIISNVIGCKPCVIKNGTVVAYLNPNNYAVTIDGDDIDIADESTGDVMIEFSHLWYQLRVSGNYLIFRITGNPLAIDDTWTDAAFMSDTDGHVCDHMYYGAYPASAVWNSGSFTLHSTSGKRVEDTLSIQACRNAAAAKGTVYSTESWAKRCYILMMLILVTKCKNPEQVIGTGTHNSSGRESHGKMDRMGLFYSGRGTVSAYGAKMFGIEFLTRNNTSYLFDGFHVVDRTHVAVKQCGPYTDDDAYSQIAHGATQAGNIMTFSVAEKCMLVPQYISSTNYGFGSNYNPSSTSGLPIMNGAMQNLFGILFSNDGSTRLMACF